MAADENKILLQGMQLVVTALFSGIISLVVYIWVSSRKEHTREMKRMDEDIDRHEDEIKDHEGRLIFLETEHANNTCGKRKKR